MASKGRDSMHKDRKVMETVSIPRHGSNPASSASVSSSYNNSKAGTRDPDPDGYEDDFESYADDFEEEEVAPVQPTIKNIRTSAPAPTQTAVPSFHAAKASRSSPVPMEQSSKSSANEIEQLRRSMQQENEAAMETASKKSSSGESKDEIKAHLK
jgi:hypothetical protein